MNRRSDGSSAGLPSANMAKQVKDAESDACSARKRLRTQRCAVAMFAVGVLGLVAFMGSGAPSAGADEACPNEAIRAETSSTSLPDCRAYELVSPPDKNGGDVVPDAQRTRAAMDGSAVGFTSFTGFVGILGTSITSDYVSVRSSEPDPGTNGWSTHGVMPMVRATTASGLLAQVQPFYVGEFSPDLGRGIVTTWGAIDGNADVDGVSNLYRNDALRAAGGGAYDLVSPCPLCATTAPLPDYPNVPQSVDLRPTLAAASPGLDHVLFESMEQLTADTPEQPGSCNMGRPSTACHVHLFQWDDGRLSLAGRVPALPATACDDAVGPACVPADVSLAGQGTGVSRNATNNRTPHAISDGSDGHVRVFFTQPTDTDGNTSDDLGNSSAVNRSFSGRIFMRVDGTSTVQLDVSERTPPDNYAPAQLLDASADGTRVFFMTTEALTNDAPLDGTKLYMYDASKPPSATDHLTLLSGANNVVGTLGVSDDGHYVYFATDGPTIDLWHDGTLSAIGPAPVLTALSEDISAAVNWVIAPTQARVTPDGRHLVFSTIDGTGLKGYDQGTCASGVGTGCRELYVYSADSGTLACASCDPTGATATAMASDAEVDHIGAASTGWHLSHAISADGSRVFFTTGEALVPQDVNGRLDAYEWTANGTHGCVSANALTEGCLALLSTGTSTDDSYFLDASSNGDDAFIDTREQLVGWDRDAALDLYDARVNGGFPDPATPPGCSGDTCQGALTLPPSLTTPGTTTLLGAGNLKPVSSTKSSKHLTRSQKLKRALRACKSRHKRGQRKKCESAARRRFGKSGGSK